MSMGLRMRTKGPHIYMDHGPWLVCEVALRRIDNIVTIYYYYVVRFLHSWSTKYSLL